jgi:hypothetical protein
MGKFDMPKGILGCQCFGKVSGSGAGFDGNVDVGAEWCDDFENRFGIVLDGLISENLPVLVHDADLKGVGVVVNADENW